MQTQQKTTTNKTATIKNLPSLQISNGKILTYQDIRNFIQSHCNGSLMLCKVLSQLGGVRSALIKWHVFGYNGSFNLSTILNNGVATTINNKKVKVGHSKTSPIVTLALLNGGFTPTNNPSWGTSFIKLQAVNPTKKA